MSLEQSQDMGMREVTNGIMSVFSEYMEYIINFLAPLYHYICTYSYWNAVIILIKFIPMIFYINKFIKHFYTTREGIKQKQMELEDITLQIRVVETRICLRESECAEREQLLRTKIEEFRKVRTRIQEIIIANKELHHLIARNYTCEEPIHHVSEEESKLIVDLLKELKYDQTLLLETERRGKVKCDQDGEPDIAQYEENLPSCEAESKQDYRYKIVKVTNVYKVAYLPHYVKQKRIRRANKHALLKKKMESIKKLLDDWHKTLNMVINSKLSVLNFDMQHLEIASQDAMGDHTKGNYYNLSDSDSDFRNSADNAHDDYNLSWSQNQYRPVLNDDDFNTNTTTLCDVEECDIYINHDEKYDSNRTTGLLFIVPEETRSQVEIEEIKSDVS